MNLVVDVVGAFDRFNFGDLLFAHLVRHGLEAQGIAAEYRHFSIERADLSARGGVATEELERLLEHAVQPGDAALVAGGEVLAARWSDALCGLTSPRRCLLLKVVARMLGAGVCDRIGRRCLGGTRPMPWLLPPERLGQGAKVIYNAVGGSGLDRLPGPLQAWARTQLGQCHDLSVRDGASLAVLERWQLPRQPRMVPDSAALVARMAPRARLAGRTDARGDYLVFQVGRYPAWGLLGVLGEQLRRVHAATGLELVLVPLGQAAGHEDRVPLRRLAARLDDLPLTLVEQPDVEEILGLIAGARLFVGSSLHGNLCALAYGVPRLGFGARVAKLHTFLQTWDPTQPEGCCPPDELATRALQSLATSPEENARIAGELVAASSRSFEQVAATILG